jgi:pyruvate dehydrogenase E1 component alpha subunit
VSSTVTAGLLVERAKPFMPTTVVDGNDVLAVRAAMDSAVERARSGDGPSYIECTTYRIRGHLEAEDAFLGGGKYRTAQQIEEWTAPGKDPLVRFETWIRSAGLADPEKLRAVQQTVAKKIEDAVAYAEAGPAADVELAPTLMFLGQEA